MALSTCSIPPSILSLLHQRYHGAPIRLFYESDITLEGNFGSSYLIVTEKRLITVGYDSKRQLAILKDLATSQIETFTIEPLIGSSVLSASINGRLHRIISWTNEKDKDFATIVESIQAFLELPDTKTFAQPNAYTHADKRGKTTGIKRKKTVLFRVMRFSRPYTKQLILLLLCMLAATGFGLAAPYTSKLFIDFVFSKGPTGNYPNAHWLTAVVLVLLGAHIGQQFFTALQARLSGVLGHKTVYDVRSALYAKLQQLSLSFYDKHPTGSIVSRVNQDSGELQQFLVNFMPLTIESILTLLGVGTFLFVLSWRLTAFVLLPIIATVFFLLRIFPKIHQYMHSFFHNRARLSAAVNDSVSGIRVIKSFGQESLEIKKFDSFNCSYRDAGIELSKMWSLYNPFMHVLIIIGSVLVWFVGGDLVLSGRMSIGSVVAYAGYLSMFYRPVFTLSRMTHMLFGSLSAAERLFDVLDTDPEIVDVPAAIRLEKIKGTVTFDNVTFGYNSLKPVIRNMSFEIQENEIVGLVGKSGAGKSTLINLICRLYSPDDGRILIDGHDISKVNFKDVRSHIGIVLQETFLFNGTIYENIAYAKPDATPEEVIEAAVAANVHDFILKKPDGYDTQVGERGNKLSGGEKQRISIARAILRNPRVLILDEATSSVDTETEAKIQQALDRLTHNRTTIAIAHRLSTLRNCNRLFVIDEGKLVEIGTHEELLERQGLFSRLVSTQKELNRIFALNE